MARITEIEGIGPSNAAKLTEAGVTSTDKLLEAAATPAARKQLATSTGISNKLILRWTNMADLMRIKGVGEEFSDLLEAGGVDTVPALARRNAANLHERLTEVNGEKKLTRRVPTAKEVAGWVTQAKSLPRVVNY